jgi:hypothetical protein
VIEEPLAQFTAGAPLRRHGFLGSLAPGEVAARAQARLGQPYRLADANCEHLVRDVHGVPPQSPQFRTYLAVGSVAAVAGVTGLATLVFGGMFRGRRRA